MSLRRCKADVWAAGGKRLPVEGMFHQFANQYEDCGDAGVANYTVALIELSDGRIVEAIPDTVQFLDRRPAEGR